MAVVQDDQLSQLKGIFERFDMDSGGSLTILALVALLRSIGLKPSGDNIHALLDSNWNGLVGFDELVSTMKPNMNNKLVEMFLSFDRDGNGYVSATEVAGEMAMMGQPLPYKEFWEMIKEADTDSDGVMFAS